MSIQDKSSNSGVYAIRNYNRISLKRKESGELIALGTPRRDAWHPLAFTKVHPRTEIKISSYREAKCFSKDVASLRERVLQIASMNMFLENFVHLTINKHLEDANGSMLFPKSKEGLIYSSSFANWDQHPGLLENGKYI